MYWAQILHNIQSSHHIDLTSARAHILYITAVAGHPKLTKPGKSPG